MTQLSVSDPKVETLWLKMYKVHYFLAIFACGLQQPREQEFIEAIDAIDNGISQYPSDIKSRYKNRTDLSSRVGALNPAWNQRIDSITVDVSSLFSPITPAQVLLHYR